jgi:hypothetical protein
MSVILTTIVYRYFNRCFDLFIYDHTWHNFMFLRMFLKLDMDKI